MTEADRHPRIYLTEEMTDTEDRVLRTWLGRREAESGEPTVTMATTGQAMSALVLRDDDPVLTPVRVVWMPDTANGHRGQRLREVLSARDPLHIAPNAQRRVLRSDPARCKVIEGDPASLTEMRERLAERGGGSLPDFIRRQAALALERAERHLLGTQYKVSRFVVEEITDTGRFTAGVKKLAAQLNLTVVDVERRARADLDEMVAAQSRRAIAVWDQLGRYFSRAYRLDVDTTRFEELRELNREHSLVFLPSHRSYLDPLVLRPALLANDLPLNHVMGGLNVSFWPIGPISKRSGTVFIRRKFDGDEIYKWTLREYMRFLMNKRFNLEWYIEGGRSRTGKLRPPRYGLLTYLAKAFQSSDASDVYLVPVSLVYDQLYEVSAMAAEAHGAAKRKESFRWMVGYVRAQGQRRGVAHVTVGRPLSLRDSLAQEDDFRLAIQKTGIEVSHRINEVTPVTASSLVMLAFLGIEDRALTVPELGFILGPLVDYIIARKLPTAGDVDLTNPQVIRRALFTHLDSGVLERYDEGNERVYYLGKDQGLVAAFYRNNTIHFLLVRAIAEMVLCAAVDEKFADPLTDGWAEAKRIRDLLKYEFFFSDKTTFREELRSELSLIDPAWESDLSNPEHVAHILDEVRPYLAHRVLQPFLEAYEVVADHLLDAPVAKNFDEKTFLAECLALAQQRRLRQQIASSESVSSELFATALQLARNRRLIENDDLSVETGRRAFADEIRTLVRRVREIRARAHAKLDEVKGADSAAEFVEGTGSDR
ncbi:glycerol-3-phosphate 1-O-acyltransferase [Prescottella equi]|uniref:Glycerol-3-phosphate 1-O-acyltransferase n=1 Tax=Rhodococcus hoagii TaxID=43767 RepID=A0AAE5IPE1_RHOHA|nr:glycerol-3-phosphate 1-O-acyltransferase [Prescottella equi]ERN46370.1 glycerol-3-phosphate acyltransferase [Prescottella equi NBRC 101255 = C 7]MBM4626008.1 glycerol-3-phosphate 1-O-acyltransferase [Prescottella equi]ORL25557.1 glycerol-3-phosphate acyltransferase [Prescottella equi]ORM23745.1 glycerol-3-phosphate acyltransferase [Prescottella equi]QPQ75879.1 glycerol-3-phosphate 1-O-acyltransferase [Prescottella equi]